MKAPTLLTLGLASLLSPTAFGEILNFDISPPGTSAGTGLSPANEVPVAASGTGSGDEILQGIRFDTSTHMLHYAIGYGSETGFTDLTGPVTGAHIHGPAPVGMDAPPIHDFLAAMDHLPAGDPAKGGVILGSVPLPPPLEAELIGGHLYINLHTDANPGGEIRGQLIQLLNVPPEIACPESTTLECTGHDGTPALLSADVSDADGDELLVTWTVDGVEVSSEIVPSGGDTTAATVELETLLGLGEHTVLVAVADDDGETASCDFTVTVVDTTPPEIHSVNALPGMLWPPNHKMRPVRVRVDATDICSETVVSRIISIESNEPVDDIGDGSTEPDWEITGDLAAKLRAERSGPGDGRIYTITIEATDESGNSATATTEVTVPHSRGGARRR